MSSDENPILVVVPTLNEAANIDRVQDELLAGCTRPLQVVVADGGSRDGTRAIVAARAQSDPRIALIDNPARIQSAGINLAVRSHGGGCDWLVRADAHASYPPGFVETLIDEAVRTGADSVVVAMVTRASGLLQRAIAAAQNSRLGNGGASHRLGGRAGWTDHGHHALMRLELFRAVGGYDESFSHNEDAELDMRLRAAGGRIWLTDRAAIEYHPRRTLPALWRQYLAFGRGRAATLLKHAARPRLRQILPLAVAPALALFGAGVVGLVAGAPGWAIGACILPAALWALACIAGAVMLALRERSAAILLAAPAAMVMHAAWSVGFLGRLAGSRR